MPAHAEDLAAVLAELGTGPVVVVGHSMGAFASVVLANLFPERVRSLVLVDGGLPLQVPAELSDEQIVATVLGPAAERLNATFPSREVYRTYWRQHPAFSADWSPLVEEYVDYDLTGRGTRAPAGHPVPGHGGRHRRTAPRPLTPESPG